MGRKGEPKLSPRDGSMRDNSCQRCGELLDPTKKVWLELNSYTGRYTDPDKTKVLENESQGLFWFGRTCAKKVLVNGGLNDPPKGGTR